MNEPAQQPAPHNWAAAIDASIAQYQANGPNPAKVMRRVPQEVRELNPKHYQATLFPIGLFNRTTFDSLRTRADRCKVAMAAAVVAEIAPNDWHALCAWVVPNPHEIRDHYDEVDRHPSSPDDVRSVLTLDAVFVAVYLGTSYHRAFASCFPSLGPAALGRILEKREISRIVNDLLKAENQIPLALIREALRALVGNSGGLQARASTDTRVRDALAGGNNALVEEVLSVIFGVLVPQFRIPGYDADVPNAAMRGLRILDSEHFLEGAYRATIRNMGHDVREEGLVAAAPILMPSAKELRKAGIEFHGRKGATNIEFRAGTIYLPTLMIDRGSERFWKNLVAYEQMSAYDQDAFLQYLKFMARLIETEDDVMLLRSGKFPTIENISTVSNKDVAKLFNTVLQNTYAGSHRRWGQLYQHIYQFYNQRRRQQFVEFKETHCSKPWLLVSVIAASILLISTLLQTSFTIAEY